MKVKELIELLQQFNPEYEVVKSIDTHSYFSTVGDYNVDEACVVDFQDGSFDEVFFDGDREYFQEAHEGLPFSFNCVVL